MDDSITSRVNRGIHLLDKVDSRWRNKIDLEELDLGHIGKCVLGQIYGDWWAGVTFLFDGGVMHDVPYDEDLKEASIEHGFEKDQHFTYDNLRRAWMYELQKGEGHNA